MGKGCHYYSGLLYLQYSFQNPFLNYQYQEILQDPIGVVRKVYGHIGEELTQEVEGRMLEYLRIKPQHVHGRFPHSLDQYGLTRTVVAEKCKHFVDYFLNNGVAWDDLIWINWLDATRCDWY